MTAVDPRLVRARDALETAALHPIEALPPSVMARELAELRQALAGAVSLIEEDAASEDAGKLAAIRAVVAEVLADEHASRQFALEEIGRIAAGGER